MNAKEGSYNGQRNVRAQVEKLRLWIAQAKHAKPHASSAYLPLEDVEMILARNEYLEREVRDAWERLDRLEETEPLA